ncbi:hypothetical protein BGW37DRAFT_520027 [Umbelopsis sp. PMI_123]|nr:hypothetical protein BGW37DRAFT_520027 [Umbelopsis sp. PMI_123]
MAEVQNLVVSSLEGLSYVYATALAAVHICGSKSQPVRPISSSASYQPLVFKESVNMLVDISSISTSVAIKYETWLSCDGGTITEFKKIPTGWYHDHEWNGPENGINKYLEDVETVFRDEDSVMNSFKDRNNICIVGIDLGEVCTAAACAININGNTVKNLVVKRAC